MKLFSVDRDSHEILISSWWITSSFRVLFYLLVCVVEPFFLTIVTYEKNISSPIWGAPRPIDLLSENFG